MTKRVGFKVSDKVHEWYVKKAEEMGISLSALAAIAMSDYMEEREALKTVQDMGGIADVFQKFEKTIEAIESKKAPIVRKKK